MNTLNTIKDYEEFLECLNNKYTLIYFGASQLLEVTLNYTNVIKPKYICDNDISKVGKEKFGHIIHHPSEIFNKTNKQFVVIVTSMYFTEIYAQLEKYKNIKIIKPSFYLKQLEESSILNISPNLSHEYTINNTLGIKIKIKFSINKVCKDKFYDYLSYCNKKIIEDDNREIDFFYTKYNCNFKSYKKILEWSIFKALNDSKKEITVNCSISNFEIIEKTKEILNTFDAGKFERVKLTQKTKRIKDHALLIHLYYTNMIDILYEELLDSIETFDIFISVTIDCSLSDIQKLLQLFPDAEISIHENRGRDILPFLNMCKTINSLGYKSFCKIHTKKSPHRKSFGKEWGSELRDSLFKKRKEILRKFTYDEKKVYVHINSLRNYRGDRYSVFSQENLIIICNIFNENFNENFHFPAGTMFWGPTLSIQQFYEFTIDNRLFVIESDILDGCIEHALERFIGFLIKKNGFELVGIK